MYSLFIRLQLEDGKSMYRGRDPDISGSFQVRIVFTHREQKCEEGTAPLIQSQNH